MSISQSARLGMRLRYLQRAAQGNALSTVKSISGRPLVGASDLRFNEPCGCHSQSRQSQLQQSYFTSSAGFPATRLGAVAKPALPGPSPHGNVTDKQTLCTGGESVEIIAGADDILAINTGTRSYLYQLEQVDAADTRTIAHKIVAYCLKKSDVALTEDGNAAIAEYGEIEGEELQTLGLTDEQLYETAAVILGIQRPVDTAGGAAPPIESWPVAAAVALPLFRYLGQHGNTDAYYTYGTQLMMGLGCDKDEAAAADVYTSLSLKGHSQATYNLASMYAEGRGVKQSVTRAVALYDVCTKMGMTRAYAAVGSLFRDGLHVEPDLEQAFAWFQRGADADCPHAHVALAHMYSHGKGGCDQDFTRAFEHHLKAADAGLALAQYNLATQYFAGKGVANDMAQAVHYYALAAEQGFIYAQINLGNMYNTGFGVDEDLEKAREYYAMAAPYSADARGLLESVEEKIRDADRYDIDDAAMDADKITADNIQSTDSDVKK